MSRNTTASSESTAGTSGSRYNESALTPDTSAEAPLRAATAAMPAPVLAPVVAMADASLRTAKTCQSASAANGAWRSRDSSHPTRGSSVSRVEGEKGARREGDAVAWLHITAE
jgi:hypothetical protein